MTHRVIILIVLLGMGCKSDIIYCPDYKPLRMKENNPFRSKRKNVPSLSASSVTSKKEYYRERPQPTEAKKVVSIEDWDCPKPGGQRSKKIVKENIKRMERKLKDDSKRKSSLDSLSIIPVVQE